MIRINLLGGPKVVAVTQPEGAPGISPTAIAAAVIAFVVFGGGVGATYIYWSHQISTLKAQIDSLSREYTRLQTVKQQADQYLLEKNQYQQRIDTITGLQRSAKGPVELMQSVGYEADRTSDVYLESISTSGDRLTVNGTSISITSLANFLGSLDKNGNFTDVTLKQAYEDDLFKRTAYKFALDCEFKPLAPSAGATPGAGQPGTPAGGRTAKPGI
jgi:Tfp pilus assembly protein PilN